MIRLTFSLNLALEADQNAHHHLMMYKRSTRPEIIRSWFLLASLSAESQNRDTLMGLYPFTYTLNSTLIEVRCSRELPDKDPVLQACLTAKTLRNKDKEIYLRALLLLGREIHIGSSQIQQSSVINSTSLRQTIDDKTPPAAQAKNPPAAQAKNPPAAQAKNPPAAQVINHGTAQADQTAVGSSGASALKNLMGVMPQ